MHLVFPVMAALLLISSTAIIAQESLSPTDVLALREDAERAYDERDAESAAALFKALTEYQPDDPDSWFGLSRAYEWNEQFELAAEAAERCQELGFIYDAYMSYRLARLHALSNNEAKALQWLETSLQQGHQNRPGISTDDAFVSLANNKKFQELAGALTDDNISRNAGLIVDLDYLVEEAQRLHAGLNRPAYSEKFLRAADEVRDSIPDASDVEVLAGFMRLTAILDDGHTGIYGPDEDSPLQLNGDLLPLTFYWFEEGVYVINAAGLAAEFIGQRVISLGGLPAEEVLQRLSVYRGVDNAMTWKWMGPQFYLGQVQMLQLVGAASESGAVRIAFEDASGMVSQQTIQGGDFARQRKLRPSPAIAGDVPTYLSNIDDSFWTRSLPRQDALYFQFNQVRNTDDESIAEFADRLAALLANEDPSALIVDMRHNNGGNNTLVQPLVKTLITYEQRSESNQIYVITGRNTFSAAQNFINRIEQWTDAVFVGEPSASSPNFVGEETTLLLPYSRVRGSISNRYWQDSQPFDQRPWITPALPVAPTAADYFSGRDAALEAILEVVANNRDR
jgi:hypothetical protein